MHLQDIALAFLSILLEALPFVLLGTLLSGIIDAFLPSNWITRLLPQRTNLALLASGLLGLIFPVCECGIVPVIRRLMVKGLPVSCAITYMLATPVVNPITTFSTWVAFRGQSPETMTCLRLLMAYALAVGVGWIVMRIPTEALLRPSVLKAMATQPGYGSASTGTFRHRLLRANRTAAGDFIDVASFLVLGALLAALFNTAIPQTALEPLAEHTAAAIFGMMGLAFILALCSSSDAFIAAVFFAFPSAAKLAFLVFGPMMDLKLVFLYGTTFRRRWVAALALGLFIIIGLCCLRTARTTG